MATGQGTRQAGDPQDPSRPGPGGGDREATPGVRALAECRTGPYLLGRLVGLAGHLARRRPGASCERYADKIAGGGLPPFPLVIANLDGMLARDLARPGTPGRLGELGAWPAAPWPSASTAAADFLLGQHH
jgi:hypothetical protein